MLLGYSHKVAMCLYDSPYNNTLTFYGPNIGLNLILNTALQIVSCNARIKNITQKLYSIYMTFPLPTSRFK